MTPIGYKKTYDHYTDASLVFTFINKMSEVNMHKYFLNTFWEFTRGVEEDKDSLIQKTLKVFKTFKVKSLKAPKLDVSVKKIACNLVYKDMRETKEELKGVTVSEARAIISKEWKNIKASEKKMKKYRHLYESEKQRYEEALQRYQEDHLGEVVMISQHKRGNKTAENATTNADTGAKTTAKAPRIGYRLFLREQLGNMTEEERKTYRSIVSRRSKKIKEDPARLFAYNNRARQMKNEAEKPTKSGNDLSVSSMVQHEETMTERFVVKRTQRQPQKTLKSPEFIRTESDVPDDDDEEQEPTAKIIQKLTKKAPKSPKLVDTDPEDSENDDKEKEPVMKKEPKSPGPAETDPEPQKTQTRRIP